MNFVMPLTLRPFMWSHEGNDITGQEPIAYEIEGLSGKGRVIIEAITTGQGITWTILSEGEALSIEYSSPQEALAAFEAE